MYTKEQIAERREARKIERSLSKQLAVIEAARNQKPVKSMTITIEWKKSRTWGSNPHAAARVQYCDGRSDYADDFTCSGCGYDKESTVIADIFNRFLQYKLYQPGRVTREYRTRGTGAKNAYGIANYKNGEVSKEGTYCGHPYYSGGVGASCYTTYSSPEYDQSVAGFIGGTFRKIASGSTFDVYEYTDDNYTTGPEIKCDDCGKMSVHHLCQNCLDTCRGI